MPEHSHPPLDTVVNQCTRWDRIAEELQPVVIPVAQRILAGLLPTCPIIEGPPEITHRDERWPKVREVRQQLTAGQTEVSVQTGGSFDNPRDGWGWTVRLTVRHRQEVVSLSASNWGECPRALDVSEPQPLLDQVVSFALKHQGSRVI
jgi:hypothetical protein